MTSHRPAGSFEGARDVDDAREVAAFREAIARERLGVEVGGLLLGGDKVRSENALGDESTDKVVSQGDVAGVARDVFACNKAEGWSVFELPLKTSDDWRRYRSW